ncbi:Perilipin-3, partial [Ophiophagus hannah]
MSSMKPDQGTMSSETSDESLEEENILKRVSSLPLVCSVCDLVSSNYTSIKRKNSYLQTVCDGAEKGVKTLTGAAVSRAQPLLNSLEPQLATANKYVCRGLDTVEQRVPILQQRADQNAVTRRLSGMVGITKDVVQNGVKTTASFVSSSMTVVMGTRMGKMAKNRTGMDPVQEVQTQIKCNGYLACVLSLLNKFQRYISQQSWCHLRHANESLQIVLENTF